jgi:cytochrome b pre-mRNA-processing protein 3
MDGIGRNRGVMLLERLFRPRPAREAGRALYASAVAQARLPELYVGLGVPDTAEGRFEAYSLHVVLLLDRLRGQGAAAAEVSQGLFDAYVKDLDHALREMGVGDLSVGRKMRKLGEAFYGRAKSYEAAFADLPDRARLEALLCRTVYAEADAGAASRLADHVTARRAALADQPLAALLAGQATWGAA